MKLFFKKIITYCSLTLVVFVLLFLFFSCIERFPEERNSYDYAFLGHSHVALGIDPSIIKIPGKEIVVKGVQGQSLFWTIKSAEKLLNKNKVDYLFIAYTNNSLTTDWWTYSDDRLMKSASLFQLNFNDLRYLFRNNISAAAKLFFSLPLPLGNVAGSFKPSNGNYIDNELKTNGKRIKEQFKVIDSFENLHGYKTIYDFCIKNPTQKVILFRLPLSKSFFNVLGESANEDLFMASVWEITKLPNVKWMDYCDSIENESAFLNVDHLNLIGSNLFSGKLKSDLLTYF